MPSLIPCGLITVALEATKPKAPKHFPPSTRYGGAAGRTSLPWDIVGWRDWIKATKGPTGSLYTLIMAVEVDYWFCHALRQRLGAWGWENSRNRDKQRALFQSLTIFSEIRRSQRIIKQVPTAKAVSLTQDQVRNADWITDE